MRCSLLCSEQIHASGPLDPAAICSSLGGRRAGGAAAVVTSVGVARSRGPGMRELGVAKAATGHVHGRGPGACPYPRRPSCPEIALGVGGLATSGARRRLGARGTGAERSYDDANNCHFKNTPAYKHLFSSF